MAATLATARAQVEERLIDPTNLIYATATLDEALKAALGEISNAYGSAVALKDLDGAAATTFDDEDLIALITGAAAYALRFRTIEKYEEASPTREDLDEIARIAAVTMEEFQGLLTHIRLRRFQESLENPYTSWDWDEGDSFS